jgi:hypothetical protein
MSPSSSRSWFSQNTVASPRSSLTSFTLPVWPFRAWCRRWYRHHERQHAFNRRKRFSQRECNDLFHGWGHRTKALVVLNTESGTSGGFSFYSAQAAGSVLIKCNIDPTNAFNGTIVISFMVLKN